MAILTSTRLLAVERLLLALWVGGICVIGYLVTPILFATLTDDRQTAGMLAGKMFSAISWAGLVIGTLLLIASVVGAGTQWLRQWRCWTLVSMLVVVILMLFVIQPMMAELKTQGPVIKGTELAAEFGRLHGISSGLYLLMSLSGLTLVAAGLRRP
ncbi:MAG: DUF4149 domain-containing protein [Thiotrichaceae bacterium]|nr:DUF4149 domain-containing protein [Thiotrichaceae bacterium]MBL1261335.1 DUF4149 domain-containing protein [Thiotrichaceae bacterium]PCI11163.1 MAG: hypothetical protein COB71_12055 [Thiotrichales bacterium]PCI12864.1 MAG: hypothetical protein COB71_07650 [Thiotrichales bacterium]